MNTFDLSKAWFEFAFENDVKPQHAALYFFIIDKANRSGWKEKTDLQTTLAMEATGIGSHKTYKAALEDLNKWGFIDWVYRSKNQYKCNQVVLNRFEHIAKALTKADVKQVESTCQSSANSVTPYINLQTSKPLNLKTGRGGDSKKEIHFPFTDDEFLSTWSNWKVYKKKDHKFSYKSEQSEQAALNKLKGMARNSSEAISIINQSIANGWKGFFELKKKNQKRDFNDYLSEAEETKRIVLEQIELSKHAEY